MTVTGERLIASIRAHAANQPDYIYQRVEPERVAGELHSLAKGACVYVIDGKPSCIAGHALFDTGLVDQDIENWPTNSWPFRDLANSLGLEIDPEEKQWIIDVQNNQDLGYAWGESVVMADKAALERILASGV